MRSDDEIRNDAALLTRCYGPAGDNDNAADALVARVAADVGPLLAEVVGLRARLTEAERERDDAREGRRDAMRIGYGYTAALAAVRELVDTMTLSPNEAVRAWAEIGFARILAATEQPEPTVESESTEPGQPGKNEGESAGLAGRSQAPSPSSLRTPVAEQPEPTRAQSQASLIEQMAELIPLANRAGLYDAADYLKDRIVAVSVSVPEAQQEDR